MASSATELAADSADAGARPRRATARSRSRPASATRARCSAAAPCAAGARATRAARRRPQCDEPRHAGHRHRLAARRAGVRQEHDAAAGLRHGPRQAAGRRGLRRARRRGRRCRSARRSTRRAGKVRLTSAADAGGATQAGLFYDGEFTTGQQVVDGVGLTVLTLAGRCRPAAAARAAAAQQKKKRKKTNSPVGRRPGQLPAAGRHASATVRGTKWLVEDGCEGTTVRVATGSVRVENLVDAQDHGRSAPATASSSALGRSGAGSSTSTTRGFVAGRRSACSRGWPAAARRLSAALGGALRCSVTPRAAARRVSAVIENRASIRTASPSSARRRRGRGPVART